MLISCVRIVKYTILKLLLFQLTEEFMFVKSSALLLFLVFIILYLAKQME